MFKLAFLIGIYSYLIFFLGIIGFLYKNIIGTLTIFFLVSLFLIYRNSFKFYNIKAISLIITNQKIIFGALFLLLIQIIINVIGALGPETAFDALWYHLTLPKLYLLNHKIFYIPGGLLYYSGMPKLTEMIYASALALGNEITAKIVHFTFGVLSLVALYKLSRTFFTKNISILVLIIFYSNLVVAWESTTAYVDLARTFYEIMALWGFVNWLNKKEKKWLLASALLLGFAISTKLLAFGSLFIFSILIAFVLINKKKIYLITNILVYWCISIIVVLPWFIFSFLNTGNFVYPFFSPLYKTSVDTSLINPLKFIEELWTIFTHADDPISPIYIMVLPFLVYAYKRINKKFHPLLVYSLVALIVWYFTPRTGGGRFILPYLSVFSIVAGGVIGEMREMGLRRIFIILVIFISLISIIYRGLANMKYLPVMLGRQTKSEFLSQNLDFSFADFYDTDEYFKKNIKQKDTVLLYGFHNLYYVNFPFIDSSWVNKGDKFNYIAVQDTFLPGRFKSAKMIYFNNKTNVKVFSKGGEEWVY